MNIEKYIIKKNKTDLESSLKELDEKILKKLMKNKDAKNIKELKNEIIDEFEFCLDMAKDDIFSIMYFKRLLEHEDSEWMSAYHDDIEAGWCFVYENGNYLSYYIADEIKKIIKKILKL